MRQAFSFFQSNLKRFLWKWKIPFKTHAKGRSLWTCHWSFQPPVQVGNKNIDSEVRSVQFSRKSSQFLQSFSPQYSLVMPTWERTKKFSANHPQTDESWNPWMIIIWSLFSAIFSTSHPSSWNYMETHAAFSWTKITEVSPWCHIIKLHKASFAISINTTLLSSRCSTWVPTVLLVS